MLMLNLRSTNPTPTYIPSSWKCIAINLPLFQILILPWYTHPHPWNASIPPHHNTLCQRGHIVPLTCYYTKILNQMTYRDSGPVFSCPWQFPTPLQRIITSMLFSSYISQWRGVTEDWNSLLVIIVSIYILLRCSSLDSLILSIVQLILEYCSTHIMSITQLLSDSYLRNYYRSCEAWSYSQLALSLL